MFEDALGWLLSRNPAYTLAGGVIIPFVIWAAKVGWTKGKTKWVAFRNGDHLPITARTANLLKRVGTPPGWVLDAEELVSMVNGVRIQVPKRKRFRVQVLACDITRELNRKEKKLLTEAARGLREVLLLAQTNILASDVPPAGGMPPMYGLPMGTLCSGAVGSGVITPGPMPSNREPRRGVHSAG